MHRPRTIVTADPELDDLNSMIRLLLHSNELRIEGLVYASSRFHWKGDEAGTTFFHADREYSEPQTSFRWKPGERFIDDAVDAYERVQPTLAVHDPRYPTGAELRSIVRTGNVDFEGDMSTESPGSQLIAAALLDDDPEPIHIQVWAGTSTVARALLTIEERFADSIDWTAIKAEVSRKAIITKFASQDDTYDAYIRPNWPGIRVTEAMGMGWGYMIRRVLLPEDRELIGAEWTRQNVITVGPLGALYRVWGDGIQMVPGDVTDFFHESGKSRDELAAQGYMAWMDPQPKGEWISEGDTLTMLNVLPNGLRGSEHPSFGGWAGRATRTADGPDTWQVVGSVDAAPDGSTPDEYSSMRWFADAQRDFVTRMQWSVTPRYEDANHHPVVQVSPGLDLTAAAGAAVELAAEATDPDGDALAYEWWQYLEAGSCPEAVQLDGSDGPVVSFAVPIGAESGQTIHLLLRVTDSAAVPLAAYARVIVTVA
ncbi:DUF1593 domain-containing protein [Naasia lichenicola]|uniref:DUF1593 domain-containing protein n=1 Tax=Naasia lichenicola TaxID=2565933 RepID=A0A4S4FGL2_9MICO|nr:DUF1593 domain-containing protein [Naasia lichenicola]THG29363.1 DUF1593 domain-containing protein [Naasia lichenicola]